MSENSLDRERDNYSQLVMLESAFADLSKLTHSFNGSSKKLRVSSPDGITIRIEPIDGELSIQFYHHNNSGLNVCSVDRKAVRLNLDSTIRDYEIFLLPH